MSDNQNEWWVTCTQTVRIVKMIMIPRSKNIMFKKSLLLIMLISSFCYADYGDLKLNKNQIVNVYDGDTIKINVPLWPPIIGKNIEVRLIGMDTPEMHGKCEKEITMAKQAKAFLIDSIDKSSSIELKHMGRDKYFRIDAELWLDGVNIGQREIQLNLAKPYNGGAKKPWC